MKRASDILLLLLLLSGCTIRKEETAEIVYDLSCLNDTMAYSQLIVIIKDPDEYLGKGIRLKGIYTANFNGYTNDYNHTLTIQDNTQCCAQGIEFILKDNKDYPHNGEEITVCGILDLFIEGKHSYCYIRDAVIE